MTNDKLKSGAPVIPNEASVYLDGPKSRGYEFVFALKVFWQFISGFRKLHFAGPCITVFGSARFGPEHPWYKAAEAIGRQIAHLGFTTLTGGGPGIMQAANKGAFEAGGQSIGCSIELPFEETPNPYVHQSVHFEHFFVRKVLLVKYSYAFVIMPGGFGTMDELFETLTLVQTRSITQFPVILFGRSYYQDLWNYMQKMAEEGTISKSDLDLVLLTDNIEEAIRHISAYVADNYTVKPRKRRWWLIEKR